MIFYFLFFLFELALAVCLVWGIVIFIRRCRRAWRNLQASFRACPYCLNQMRARASVCPHCGRESLREGVST